MSNPLNAPHTMTIVLLDLKVSAKQCLSYFLCTFVQIQVHRFFLPSSKEDSSTQITFFHSSVVQHLYLQANANLWFLCFVLRKGFLRTMRFPNPNRQTCLQMVVQQTPNNWASAAKKRHQSCWISLARFLSKRSKSFFGLGFALPVVIHPNFFHFVKTVDTVERGIPFNLAMQLDLTPPYRIPTITALSWSLNVRVCMAIWKNANWHNGLWCNIMEI